MKINFILSFLIFNIVLSQNEYDLIDGIDKQINDIKKDQYYYFYINASLPNILRFTLTIPSDKNYFDSSVDIYECKNREEIYNAIQLYAKRVNINNTIIYYFSYDIKSPLINNIKIVLYSSGNMNLTFVRCDILDKEYDLYNNKSFDISNFYSNKTYFLYLTFLFESKAVNITFIIDNNISQEPFSEISIFEYEKRYAYPSLGIVKKPISFTTKNNQLIASFSYDSKFYNISKYIALKIKPSKEINHMIASYNNLFHFIDLRNDTWITIDNLISDEHYLFFIEAKQFDKANVTFIINNTDNNPFDYITIYEYEQKNNSNDSYILKKLIYIDKKPNRDFISQILYTVYSNKTNYLAFSIIPKYNINQIFVKVDISGQLYEFYNNTYRYIKNLNTSNDYFFFIRANQFDFINFTLIMDYQTKEPFSYIFCKELYGMEYSKYNETIIQPISSIINKGKLIVTIYQNISNYETNYIFFRISPSYNIDYILVNMDITNCLIDVTYSFKGYYLKSNLIYYLKASYIQEQKYRIILSIYDSQKIDFALFKTYDCIKEYESLSSCAQNSSVSLEKNRRKIKNEKRYNIIINNNYNNNLKYYYYIEMMSKYDINHMRSDIYPYKIKKPKFSFILSIIFPIILMIAIIIYYIITKFKKCKILDFMDSSEISLNPNNQNENEDLLS